MTNEVIGELAPIQRRIGEHETESIVARWEFGRVLIKQRTGKQLPRGLRDRVRGEFGLEASEITRRMQLAEKFETRTDVKTVCEKWGGAWRRIIREELTSKAKESTPSDFGKRAEWRLNKWISELGDDAALRAELKMVLQNALTNLNADRVEVAV